MYKLILKYFVVLHSFSFCMGDSVDIYKDDKQLLSFEPYFNLSVVINYNKTMDYLEFQFNGDVSQNLTLIIRSIPTINTDSQCDTFDFVTNISEPESFIGAYDLNFGCTYNIIVNEGLSLNYSIPYCVDAICDCDFYPIPMNITVGYQQKNKLLVEWNFTNAEDEKTIKNITFIWYNSADCAIASEKLYYPKYKLFDSNNTALVYIEDYRRLCLLSIFTNKYGCDETYLRTVEVVEVTEPKQGDNSTWINISYATIIPIPLLFVIALWFIHKYREIIKAVLIARVLNRRRHHNIYRYIPERKKWAETNNITYIEREILDGLVDKYELPRNHFNLLHEIGKGAFGEVYFGNAFINGKEEPVAVKTLRKKSSNEEKDDFRSEIDIMKKIGQHPNIVTMLKCCTLQEPFMMIMEYVPYGDLKHYLVNLRDKWNKKQINCTDDGYNESGSYIYPRTPEKNRTPSTSSEYPSSSLITPTSLNKFTFDIDQAGILDHTELQHFALQIACGMAHLEKIPITHRDLAARNILIDANKALKISDFGLSRPGPYINKSRNKLPFRWMALEAIEDHIYDNKSDVWSFGVVLWEIGTLGAFPYDNVPDQTLIYHLHVGKRLERPEICTDELYTLMLRCWSEDPKLRPTFEELVQQLDVTKNRVYIDFTQLNPTYVFPPTRSKSTYNKEVEG